MKEKLKDFYNQSSIFIKFYIGFIIGFAIVKAIDLANYLMNYPSDISFFGGLLIYATCIGTVGYSIYSIIINNFKNKKKWELNQLL